MSVIAFTYDKQLTKNFIDLGYELNMADNNWIPPFRNELLHQLSEDFEFNKTERNSHCNFIAHRNGKPVGRISAMINKDLKDEEGKQIGTVGFFECVDDSLVAEELLSCAVSFLHKEYGIKKVYGPMNFDIWHGYRFMIKGFERELFPGEPYNKPYYNNMFIENGFAPKYYWDSTEIEKKEDLIEVSARGKVRHAMLCAKGYSFSDFIDTNFEQQLGDLYKIINSSFSNFFCFTELSLNEFSRMYSRLRHSTMPGFFSLIHNEEGTLAGFTGVLIDHSSAIKAMNGNTGIISKAKFLMNKRKANRAVYYIAGITPEQARKRSGLGRAGFYYGVNKAMEAGFERMVIALMARDKVVHGLLGKYANIHDREYALYELQL
jgi:hypothetical protein